jgi:hypothetical protein
MTFSNDEQKNVSTKNAFLTAEGTQQHILDKMHINIPVTSYTTLFESRLEISNFIDAGNS